MKSVVIVDDESLVRVGLQSLFDWEQHGYTIVGVYQNGAEALSAIQSAPPDVLLTDIRMPDMDGLTLIEKLKKTLPALNIVIMSSYDDFDYMRKAIQYGVKDYILKHKIEQDELLGVLDRLPYEQDTAQFKNADPLDDEKAALLAHLATSARDPASESFPYLRQRFSLLQAGSWVLLSVSETDANCIPAAQKALLLLVREQFCRYPAALFLGLDGVHLNAVLKTEPDQPHALNSFLSELLEFVRDRLGIQLLASVGACGSLTTIDALIERRMSALRALSTSFYISAPILMDNPFTHISEQEWYESLRVIRQYALTLDVAGLSRWMAESCQNKTGRLEPCDAVRLFQCGLHQLVDAATTGRGTLTLDMDQSLERVWRLSDAMSKAKTFGYLSGLADEAFSILASLCGTARLSENIQAAKRFVVEHSDQPISLEDAARVTNFSVNYFCLRFKQETNLTFSEFLNYVRVQKAIALLRETGLTTEAIAIDVGYPNPNYFVRVFKKVTGQTVSDFRKNIHQNPFVSEIREPES